MATHKKDLKRHDFSGSLHEVVVVAESEGEHRKSVFIDGKEVVLPAGSRIEAGWSNDDLPQVGVTIYAETIEVISWDEMEKRAY